MIKVQRQELLNKLNILEKAYNTKNHIEALSYLKFDNGKLTMSNGYTIIITRIGIENDSDFKTLIPFKLLKDIVSKLNGDDVSYFIYDMDWGKKFDDYHIIREGETEPVPMRTIEELWNYFVEEHPEIVDNSKEGNDDEE